MRPAVFFDRDGTLNEELGYVGELERFHIYPFAAAAVRQVNEHGWAAILVTNQAGVARGLYSEAQVGVLHRHLADSLSAAGARLDGIYYCPHHPTKGVNGYGIECDCRKPKPGLLRRAAAEHDLELARSWIVTDRMSEIGMLHALGGRGALVRTGYGEPDLETWRAGGAAAWPGLLPAGPDVVAATALEAVHALLAAAGKAAR
jgi:D-glycero-D-manno-heptose 1,7-bisphosphate phosphatase